MTNFKSALLGTAAVALMAGAAGSASAADDAQVVTNKAKGVKAAISGQFNRAVLFYDDGVSQGVEHVDNDASSSRFRFHADAKVNADMSIGGLFELQVESNSNSSGAIIQDTNGSWTGSANPAARKVEIWFNHAKFGRVYIGRGDSASDGVSQNSFDGAGLAVSTFTNVDQGGGLEFRDDPTDPLGAAGVQVRDVATNFDGLSRRNRIRYDTPKFFGFQGKVGHNSGGDVDASINYGGEIFGWGVAAGLGGWDAGSTGNNTGMGGSVAVQSPWGISLAGGAGKTWINNLNDAPTNNERDPFGWFGRIGYDRKFTEMGTTSIAFQYSRFDEIAADSDEMMAIGIGLNQTIDAAATDLYFGWNRYDLENDETAARNNYETIDTFILGSRLKF